MYLLLAYFFGAFAVLAHMIIPSLLWRNGVVSILIIATLIALFLFIKKTVMRKWLQRIGALTIGQIKECTVDKGIYFEQAGMWSNRIDAVIEYEWPKGVKHEAKVRDYIYEGHADDYRRGQNVPIRYWTLFPNIIAFDWSVHQAERATAVRRAQQKRTPTQ